jgi:hypothetical protein
MTLRGSVMAEPEGIIGLGMTNKIGITFAIRGGGGYVGFFCFANAYRCPAVPSVKGWTGRGTVGIRLGRAGQTESAPRADLAGRGALEIQGGGIEYPRRGPTKHPASAKGASARKSEEQIERTLHQQGSLAARGGTPRSAS